MQQQPPSIPISPMHAHVHSASCTNCDTAFTTPPHPASMTVPHQQHQQQSSMLPPKPDWPSFSVSQPHPRIATIVIKSENFDPLKLWMPWIEWDGSWIESYPLRTQFRVPINALDATVKVLMMKGFHPQQSRLAARM